MGFAAFPEQQRVVQLLQRSLERGRLGHAYLFTGSDMPELERLATQLIKALNCEAPPVRSPSGIALDSCDACSSCRKIAECLHPDVQWVRAESRSRIITIDQVRGLLQTVHLKPTQAAYKAGVIVGADRLNIQAANAFLKTLEEPPPSSILILLTTDLQRVLETILSRCLRLTFAGEGIHGSPVEREWLRRFAMMASEGANASKEAGDLINRYRLLGSLLERLGEVKAAAEQDATARSPLNRHADVDPKLRERWEDELTAATEAEYRAQRAETLKLVQSWLRDVWLCTLGMTDGLLFPEMEAYSAKVAQRISTQEAMNNLNILEGAQRLLHTNVQEALALEVNFLKLRL